MYSMKHLRSTSRFGIYIVIVMGLDAIMYIRDGMQGPRQLCSKAEVCMYVQVIGFSWD